MEKKDARLKIVGEILHGIKVSILSSYSTLVGLWYQLNYSKIMLSVEVCKTCK